MQLSCRSQFDTSENNRRHHMRTLALSAFAALALGASSAMAHEADTPLQSVPQEFRGRWQSASAHPDIDSVFVIDANAITLGARCKLALITRVALAGF
jgi:hypothetical protein